MKRSTVIRHFNLRIRGSVTGPFRGQNQCPTGHDRERHTLKWGKEKAWCSIDLHDSWGLYEAGWDDNGWRREREKYMGQRRGEEGKSKLPPHPLHLQATEWQVMVNYMLQSPGKCCPETVNSLVIHQIILIPTCPNQ